ncbi:unnamed protein product (macronuclear) [Paramecium tetraurelia]|uniref:Transmembrane protein n=1 Tax=Paramecium tetraurelia TaxID=5888 RepID=A0BZD6_PARTE|nr:uncharacterized protein GSPATT00033756001 [Paramecium tetraurelia]CAK63903.1 unnamed protein product [Paramecium tetraurelia]|eukprot:XP_001431301.1 hypothetical protein (macronuclear) [Paramecium tetraurelia strain d4-2]
MSYKLSIKAVVFCVKFTAYLFYYNSQQLVSLYVKDIGCDSRLLENETLQQQAINGCFYVYMKTSKISQLSGKFLRRISITQFSKEINKLQSLKRLFQEKNVILKQGFRCQKFKIYEQYKQSYYFYVVEERYKYDQN